MAAKGQFPEVEMYSRSICYVAACAAVSALAFFGAGGEAAAKRKSPAASALAMDQCIASLDSVQGDNQYMWGCCSKEAGICVICYKPPSPTGEDSCNVVNYRKGQLGTITPLSDGSFMNKFRK